MGINDDIPIYNYYDRQRGWENTNKGWHEVVIQVSEPHETVIRYQATVDWIKENIHGYKKHCRWFYSGNYLKYKFRHEKDYLWFKLRWG